MEKFYVYELINLMGTVEYVGETIRPKIRMSEHITVNPKHKGKGKFHNRQDLLMNIVSQFTNRQEAYDYQILLQNYYGFENDNNKHINDANNIPIDKKIFGAKKSAQNQIERIKAMGIKLSSLTYICPNCHKKGQFIAMQRWHGNNCKALK